MTDFPREPAGVNPSESTILRIMLENEGAFVSGSTLAEELSISRVAVWQYMEKLRTQGFEFEAVRARGYRLIKRPDGAHPNLIAAFIASRNLKYSLQVFDEIDSTNDEAARRLAAGEPAPLVILAKQQTRGRGRFGRTWLSNDAGNLYISFGFRPMVDHSRMQTFTLWMGVSVCDLITNFTRTSPALKWPNDILFEDRKAGGMLTEARIDADQIRDLVFGLGLNLNAVPQSTENTTVRAISLRQHVNTSVDINRFVAALIGRILDSYTQFLEGEHGVDLAERWQRHDALRGREITVIQGPHRFRGIALGIDDEGSLLLRTQGKTERFRAGEVTLEKTALT